MMKDHDQETAVLIGGHMDGKEVTLFCAIPMISTPSVRSIEFFRAEDEYPTESAVDVINYYLVLDHGHPSRDDHGRIRYTQGK